MTKIRSKEELEQWFQTEKEKRLQRKEKERLKKRMENALRAAQTKRVDKLIAEREKASQNEQQTPQMHNLFIYGTRHIERDTREEDLYTEYELRHIEELYPEETGRIRWDVFDKLVKR